MHRPGLGQLRLAGCPEIVPQLGPRLESSPFDDALQLGPQVGVFSPIASDDELGTRFGKVEDGFARKALMLMIDGTDPDALRSIMEIDIDSLARRHRENAKVFETAGGLAPTLGVLGAVMGLITVLSNLGGDTAALGHGIATAFVAKSPPDGHTLMQATSGTMSR